MLAITDHSRITERKKSLYHTFNNCLYLQENCKETKLG